METIEQTPVDFERSYLGSIIRLPRAHPGTTKNAHRVFRVERVQGTQVHLREYVKKRPRPPIVKPLSELQERGVFSAAKVRYINSPDQLCCYWVSRVPARQWRKAVHSHNTRIRPIGDPVYTALLPRGLDSAMFWAVFNPGYVQPACAWSALTSPDMRTTSIAIRPYFAAALHGAYENPVLYYRLRPIGFLLSPDAGPFQVTEQYAALMARNWPNYNTTTTREELVL